MGDGHLLGAGNFLCVVITNGRILHSTLYMHEKWVVIAHGRVHSLTTLSVQSTGTMHAPFCHSLRTKAGWVFTRYWYNDEPLQDLGLKMGVGRWYAVDVYSALYGTGTLLSY